MTSSNSAIHKFIAKQRELLDLELQAEKEEGNIDSTGSKGIHKDLIEGRRSHVLGRLEASDISVGLYGRTVVQLTPCSLAASVSSPDARTEVTDATAESSGNNNNPSSSSLLPAHRFTVGNEVEIRSSNHPKHAMSGVICAVSEAAISVAISEDKQQQSSSKSSNNNTNKNKGKDRSNNRGNKSGDKKKSHLPESDHDDETSILDAAPLTLVPRSSIEVHKRLVAALDRLQTHGEDHMIAGSVIRSVFAAPDAGSGSRRVGGTKDAAPTQTNSCFNPNLDGSQREAIAFALQPERPVALIHGPPGTGKTTTVAELIRQAVHHHGMRVLVTAPSNVAVDNILEKLTTESGETKKLPALRTVRLGHPARIKPSIAKHSLEALVQSSDGTEIVQDVRRELESHIRFLSKKGNKSRSSKSKNSRQDKLDRKTAYQEIRSLRKEVRQREEKVVSELILSAQVVLATTVGADNRVLNQITHPKDGNSRQNRDKPGFDLVIIDEAAQALEASCWIPILRGRKVVLAGDHCQLPPTIKSNDPKVVEGLGVTLFERLMSLHGTNNKTGDISRMLQIQYRMHHKIADWASQAMYRGGLSTHGSVKSRTLGQLESVQKRQDQESSSLPPKSMDENENHDLDHLKNTTLLMIDTAGCDMHERETEAGSRYNEGEAMLVCQHVRKLLELGVDQQQIAIITPYNGQVELLRNKLLPEFPKLEIRSVDGFQGGEKEAVVLSLVRSSESHGRSSSAGIGFLRDDRRQNVAVTRAKRHLAVICDSETVSQSPFIQNLLQWMGDHGEERSAIEYISENNNTNSSSHNQEFEDDLLAAESELMKLMEESSVPAASESKSPAGGKSTNASSTKDVPTNASSKESSNAQQKVLEESKRKALMDRIAAFLETGTKGEEMVLSSDLTSFDRRLVHEFAEQSGLGHRSEGREGIDRKIILSIQTESSAVILARQQAGATASNEIGKIDSSAPPQNETPKEDDDAAGSASKLASNFSALALDDSDTDESNPDAAKPNSEESSSGGPVTNSLLAELAKERAERQRQQQQQQKAIASTVSKKKKKKKPKGQKLGGAKKPPPPKEEDNLDDLDDMAFLDAQIEKAQNAHGRKVVGSGKQYRTVVNGILNSKPAPTAKPTNTRASAALRAKLSQAEKARNKKKKKK